MTARSSWASVEELRRSLADLSQAELDVTVRWSYRYAAEVADAGRPRLAAVAHAVGVLLAEEGDRREELLEALDPETAAGGFVAGGADPVGEARGELRRGVEGEAS